MVPWISPEIDTEAGGLQGKTGILSNFTFQYTRGTAYSINARKHFRVGSGQMYGHRAWVQQQQSTRCEIRWWSSQPTGWLRDSFSLLKILKDLKSNFVHISNIERDKAPLSKCHPQRGCFFAPNRTKILRVYIRVKGNFELTLRWS